MMAFDPGAKITAFEVQAIMRKDISRYPVIEKLTLPPQFFLPLTCFLSHLFLSFFINNIISKCFELACKQFCVLSGGRCQ